MTNLDELQADASLYRLRQALQAIADHETKCVMPWTHEIAADTYSSDLDRLRNIARRALEHERP